MTGTDRMPLAVYNTGPVGEKVTNKRAPVELNAIGNNLRLRNGQVLAGGDKRRPRPKGIGLLECKARVLPDLPHYGAPIHDRSRPARANLALYVLGDLGEAAHRFEDLTRGWPAPRHPARDHEPRSILIQPIPDGRIIVAHAPEEPSPRGWPGVHYAPGQLARVNEALTRARKEWVEAMHDLTAGPDDVHVLTDANGLAVELRRRRPRLRLAGHGADAILTTHTITSTRFADRINGVDLLSDHRGALLAYARR